MSRKPKTRKPKAGQVWRLQRINGAPQWIRAVLTAQIDEVTPETLMVRWLDDGSVQARAVATVIRIARDEFRLIERVE